MSVRFKIFEGKTMIWEELFEEAATFASTIAPGRLIGISHSYSHTGAVMSVPSGIVTVWYWDGDEAPRSVPA